MLLLFFFTTVSDSQTHTITGVVSEDNDKPLEYANVIAKPLWRLTELQWQILQN